MNDVSATSCKNSTIFKTINSSIDNTQKTLALFNKDWNTYKTNWQNGFSQSGFNGGVKSIFQSVNSNSTLSNNQIQILRTWNNAVKHGCTAQETFNKIIADADETTKMYFAGLNKGKGSIEGLKNAQNIAQTSTIGLTIAQTALNTAISIGLSTAISLAIEYLDKLINSSKRASEVSDKAFSETNTKVQQNNEELKSLDALISKYTELKKSDVLDLDVRKEIKEIQYDIADLVGTQAKNLDLVNGKLDDEIEKLHEISATEAKRAYETSTANYYNSQKATVEATADDSFLFMDGYTYVGKREKEAEKTLQEAGFSNNLQFGGFFNNTLFVLDSFDNNKKELKGAQEKANYLQSMIDILAQNGHRATDLYSGLIKQRDDYLKYIDDQQNAANSLVNSWIIYSQFSNEELSKIKVDSIDTFEIYRNKMIDEAKKDKSITKVLVDGTLSEKDLETAIDTYMATSLEFSTWYEQWIDNVEGLTSANKINSFWNFSDLMSQLDAAKGKLSDLDQTYAKLFDGDKDTQIGFEDFSTIYEAFSDVKGIDNYIQRLQDAGQNTVQVKETIEELISAYLEQSKILDNVTEANSSLIISMLEEMGVANAEEIVLARINAENESLAIQKQFIEAGTYDLATATLREINAFIEEHQYSEEIRIELARLALAKQTANGTSLDFSSDISNLVSFMKILGANTSALETYYKIKNGANGMPSNVVEQYRKQAEQDIQNALNSANAYSTKGNKVKIDVTPQYEGGSETKTTIKNVLNSAEDATEAIKSYIESYMTNKKAALEASKVDYQTYSRDVAKVLKDMFEQGKISAQDYHDYTKQMLEVQQGVYDSVISAVTHRIDEEIEGYEKQMDAVEERYNSEIEYLDTIKAYYEEQKSALQEANEEIDRQIALEQALYNFDRATSQRTQKVYTASAGFIYKADEDAIRDASDELRQAQLDIEIANIDKAIEQVEEQQNTLEEAMDTEKEQLQEIIDKLQAYSDQWSEAAEQYEIQQNEMYTQQLLGADWEKQILDGRLDTLNTFKDSYIAIQEVIANASLQSANAQLEASLTQTKSPHTRKIENA